VLLAVLGGPGCGLCQTATRVVVNRVRQSLQDCAELCRDRKWANEAWQKACAPEAGHSFSDDYARGFKDGFQEYVCRGGNGEPPPLPPPDYRALRYQTPEGYHAIEDWFAGYRHGAAAAREGGYRNWVTGPSSLRPPAPELAPAVAAPPPALAAPAAGACAAPAAH
jgi:hypothetical protein